MRFDRLFVVSGLVLALLTLAVAASGG